MAGTGSQAAAVAAHEFTAGGMSGRIWPPERVGTFWVVAIEDVLGDRLEKRFPNKDRALDFYTAVYLGRSATEERARAAGIQEELGVHRQARRNHVHMEEANTSGQQIDHRSRPVNNPERLNLRKVTEVLASYGLDPTVELVEVLQPITVVDPDTGVVSQEHRLSPEDRSRVLLELMQYAHPKLKSVEMKVEGTLGQMTQEQVDARLLALVQKAVTAEKGGE